MSLPSAITRGEPNGRPGFIPYVYGATLGRPSPARPHLVAAALTEGRPVRRGDEKTALILAWQDELTRNGLLPKVPGGPVSPLSSGRDMVECGTPGAAKRHRRRGEPLDFACQVAERAEQNGIRARQRAGLENPGRPGLKPCGTDAAHRRHLRNGEEPCEECRRATRDRWNRQQLCRECGHYRKSKAHREACEAGTEAAA